MPRQLLYLIRASGNAGVSGQSFRNHVTGAASGARTSDYDITAWTFAGTGEPQTGVTYSDNHVFSINLTFTQGTRAYHIKRAGAASGLVTATTPTQGGASASITGGTIQTGELSSSVSVKVRAPFGNTTTSIGNPWFDGYTSPERPPHMDPAYVTFQGQAGTATGVLSLDLRLEYVPDNGPYNPNLVKTWTGLSFNGRPRSVMDFEWEWYTNSSYTGTPVSTNYQHQILSYPTTANYTVWVRNRLAGSGGAWTNLGSKSWTDPR